MSTLWIMIGAGLFLLGWDIYVGFTKSAPTISTVMRHVARRWLIVPFMLGVLMGHFFWCP